MKCSNCGTDNPSAYSFCVKCGTNLRDTTNASIEHFDMGGYYSEGEEQSSGFTIGGGTFVINDRQVSSSSSSDLYTADELNSSDEEFDFSAFDEPFIPKLDADRVSLPEQMLRPNQNMPQMNSPVGNQFGGMQNIPPVQNMNPVPPQPMMYGQPPVNNMPQTMQNPNMPYGQPVMYGQPQFLGYDQNGQPIYGMPANVQPQFLGYDQNGQALYGIPAVQPQFIGYDQNGMPVFAPAPAMQQPAAPQPMQNNMYSTPQPPVNNIPNQNMYGQPTPKPQNSQMYDIPSIPETPKQEQNDSRVDVPDDFWAFFDGGKATKHKETSSNDFFGKNFVNDPDDPFGDKARKKRRQVDYMNDLPVADASSLMPNEADKFNKRYMRATENADASQLAYNEKVHNQDKMNVTNRADASVLKKKADSTPWNLMDNTQQADANDLVVYVKEHKESTMAQADKAVNAMPVKPKTTNQKIDEMAIPEYMQARKTVKKDKPEISSIPEL